MALDGEKADLLVYAGPGNLERPDNVALLNATNLVFFEPDPERYGALMSRFEGRSDVEVRPQALSDTAGDVRLGRYNDADFNSLRAPTDLLRFIPGLRHVGFKDVKRVNAAEFFTSSSNKDSTIRLVLDVNGEEIAILNKLAQSSLLDMFSEIHVYTGVSPLFDGAGCRSDVMELCRSHGLVVKAEVGPGGFLACVRARRNELLQTRKAEAPRADAAPAEASAPVRQPAAPAPDERRDAELDELRSQLETALQKIDALTEANQAKDAELQAQNRRASTAKTMITKLKKRVEAAREIAIERDELRVELADARAEAAESQDARAASSAQLETTSTELAQARERLEEAQTQLKSAQSACDALRAELERAQAERARLDDELGEARKQVEDSDAQRQALANDLAEAQAQSRSAQSASDALRAELERAQAERARVGDELSKARKLVEDSDAQRQKLASDLAEAQSRHEAARSEAEARAREIAEHAKSLEALKAELDERTRLAQELEARNSRFDGEFVRAEAQLDLIKELLFHDQPE